MKNSLYIAVLFLLSFNAYSASFYIDSNLEGNYFQAYSGYTDDHAGSWNDLVSSIKVEYNECVVLYKDSGYEGTIQYFSQGTYNLSDYSFNDKLSSYHVINSFTCDSSNLTFFYRHLNHSGPKFSLPIGGVIAYLDHFLAPRDWNDEITSISLGSNACVTIGEHHGFAGVQKSFTNDVNHLGTHSFNDKTSSIRVVASYLCPATDDNAGGGTGGGTGGGSIERN